MPATPVRPRTRWLSAAATGLAGSLVVGLVVLAFLWPTKTAHVRDLPVGITGPAAAVSAVQERLEAASPGTFDLVPAADRDAAVDQVRTRQTYGALVLGGPGGGAEVLTAPAGSAAATQVLTGLAGQLQAQLAQQTQLAQQQAQPGAGAPPAPPAVTTTAVVPLSADDPSGTGLAAASFPMTIGGIVGGVLVSLLVVGAARKLVALAGFGAAVGLLLTLVLQTWWHYLQGGFWLNASAVALSVLGVSAFVVGCASLLGTGGIGVGVVVNLLVGNPLSGAAAPWQFLTAPWGAVGQHMVPGASSWLVRSLSYFPDADTSRQWLVLATWTAVGVVMVLLGSARHDARHGAPRGEQQPDPTGSGESAPVRVGTA